MKLFLVYSFIIIMSLTLLNATGACGKERWLVKICEDSTAGNINPVIVPTTIKQLISLPEPTNLPEITRIPPVEDTLFALGTLEPVYLIDYKLETDGDYHLVLSDEQGNTMIAEIPSPDCISSTNGLKESLFKARQSFDNQYRVTKKFKVSNKPRIFIIGVGFFDKKHGQLGLAPNGIEIHPVLRIEFNYAVNSKIDHKVIYSCSKITPL